MPKHRNKNKLGLNGLIDYFRKILLLFFLSTETTKTPSLTHISVLNCKVYNYLIKHFCYISFKRANVGCMYEIAIDTTWNFY